jgi:hypothetical protein
MHDGIAPWISELRDRLACGELAGLGPIDLGYGTGHLPGETTVRIMLSDLDDLDADEQHRWQNGSSPSAADVGRHAERRRQLLDDFHRLRNQIG